MLLIFQIFIFYITAEFPKAEAVASQIQNNGVKNIKKIELKDIEKAVKKIENIVAGLTQEVDSRQM